MYLIIATPLSLYLYNTNSGKLETLRYGNGEYYGISWDGKSIYISSSNLDSAGLKTEEEYRKAGVGYILSIRKSGTEVLVSGIAQSHQLTVDGQGLVCVTNTGFNHIIIVEPETGQKKTIMLSDIDCEVIGTQKVGNHFNSIFEGDKYYFILAHNNGRKSAVYELDKTTFELVNIYKTNAEWAHNIWICEFGMVICNSRDGSLYEVYSGKTIWQSDENRIITRGIAANEDYIFVGRSEFGNRFTRRYSNGGFYIIDRKTLKTIEVVKFPKTGCTNEIRIFGSHDCCHPVPIMDSTCLNWIRNSNFLTRWHREFTIDKYRYRNAKNKAWKKIKQGASRLGKSIYE